MNVRQLNGKAVEINRPSTCAACTLGMTQFEAFSLRTYAFRPHRHMQMVHLQCQRYDRSKSEALSMMLFAIVVYNGLPVPGNIHGL